MENNHQTFWCHKCNKKFFIAKENLRNIPKSAVQKKLPFLDPENGMKTKTENKPADKIYKCNVCGYPMKEVKDQYAESDHNS